MHSFSLRATAVALLAGGLVMPTAVFAAPETGTVVGSVTCGAAEDLPANHVVVTVEGTHLQTTTDASGTFSLSGLPAGQSFTVDAVADPQASVVTSRFDVSVQPGQTLDIGSMDLAVCGQPAPVAPVPNPFDPLPDSGAD